VRVVQGVERRVRDDRAVVPLDWPLGQGQRRLEDLKYNASRGARVVALEIDGSALVCLSVGRRYGVPFGLFLPMVLNKYRTRPALLKC